ncbi:MAG: flavodoxin family protein [Solobacterium sp.]|nr:flavodoxin family protein [Solobacterium sp.]
MKIALVNALSTGTLSDKLSDSAESIILSRGYEFCRFDVPEGSGQGCKGCGRCSKAHACVFDDVNQLVSSHPDAVIFLFPAHYGYPSSHICGYLDRLVHSANDLVYGIPVLFLARYRKDLDISCFTGYIHAAVWLSITPLIHHIRDENDSAGFLQWQLDLEALCRSIRKERTAERPARDMSFLR